MSRDASITLTWADGDHFFRLAWGEIVKLQEECDAGPHVILQRLITGHWRVQDIANVIRWGLIGGGMKPTEAAGMVKRYVETRPPMENLIVAQLVMNAGLSGAPDEDELKKAMAPDKESGSTGSQTGSSGSGPSTEPGGI